MAVSILFFNLMLPRVCLPYVNQAFPDNSHSLFYKASIFICEELFFQYNKGSVYNVHFLLIIHNI